MWLGVKRSNFLRSKHEIKTILFMRSKVFQKCSWGQNSHFHKIESISHLKIVFISWTILQLQVRSQDRKYSYIYKFVTDTTFYIYNIVQDITSLKRHSFLNFGSPERFLNGNLVHKIETIQILSIGIVWILWKMRVLASLLEYCQSPEILTFDLLKLDLLTFSHLCKWLRNHGWEALTHNNKKLISSLWLVF